MRHKFSLLLLLFFLGLTAPLLAEPPENYPFIRYDEGLQQAKAQNRYIFLYFGRFGCGFCGKTNIETFSDTTLRQLYIKNYVLVYVDAESGERVTLPDGEIITETDLGLRLNVFATPMFVYLDPNGKVVFKAPGFKTVEEFKQFDAYVQGRHYEKQSINDFLKNPS
jgi:thioredoxin-related protein